MSLNQGLELQNGYGVILTAGRVLDRLLRASWLRKEGLVSRQSLISIVDDDQSFRDSMRRLLRSLGYAVATFPSADEFLASPDLAVTACLVADIHMPAMTGVALYERLVGTGHAIPTILVTAYPNDMVRQRMLTLGVECYLRKPLEEAALIGCLRSAVGHHTAR
jgi:FixJ family two-component response regulator